MTRIDSTSPEEREALKDEIKAELRQDNQKKQIRSCLLSLVIIFVVFALPVVVVSTVLAKTGFVNVPIFSNWLYVPSMPIRDVTPLVGSSTDVVIRGATLKTKFDLVTKLATLSLNEVQLTTVMHNSLVAVKAGVIPISLRSAQIAIDPSAMEIFLVSPQKERDATIRFRFVPVIKNEKLEVEIKELVIGNLVVPQALGTWIFNLFAKRFLDDAVGGVGNFGQLMSTELGTGKITIVLRPRL